MLQCIRIELQKAFFNIKMLWVLCAACVISLSEIVTNVVQAAKLNAEGVSGEMPISAFEKMLPLIGVEAVQFYVFLFTIVILAAIPYAGTTFSEQKNGVVKNVFIRTKKSNYYVAKYLATFLSGGVVVVVPLLLNIIATAMLLPSIRPDVATGYYGIFDGYICSDLFYSHPYGYLFVYLLMDFVIFGLLNTISITMVWFIKNSFAILMMPFLFYIGGDLLAQATGYTGMSLPTILYPMQVFPVRVANVLIYIVILLVIAVISCIVLAKREDVL